MDLLEQPTSAHAVPCTLEALMPSAAAVERARAQVRRSPYVAVFAAAGLGVLVGGSMWGLMARTAVSLAVRAALGSLPHTLNLSRDVSDLINPQEPS